MSSLPTCELSKMSTELPPCDAHSLIKKKKVDGVAPRLQNEDCVRGWQNYISPNKEKSKKGEREGKWRAGKKVGRASFPLDQRGKKEKAPWDVQPLIGRGEKKAKKLVYRKETTKMRRSSIQVKKYMVKKKAGHK